MRWAQLLLGACSGACWAVLVGTVEILSTTDALCAGLRCEYRAAIAIVLWPAASCISLVDAPALANHELNWFSQATPGGLFDARGVPREDVCRGLEALLSAAAPDDSETGTAVALGSALRRLRRQGYLSLGLALAMHEYVGIHHGEA
jgi:hypothetical protein